MKISLSISVFLRLCGKGSLAFASLRLCGILLSLTIAAFTQIPTPKEVLGFTPGDDRKLASWAQVVDYFNKLNAASDRVMFREIGTTTMGAPFVYATISTPENLKSLAKYKEINAKLADPRTLTGGQASLLARNAAAKRLIAQGKTIVLITHGIHSTEVGSTLSSMLIAYRLASSNEPEIKKILDNTIILIVPSLNPDGVDIVKNWYDKTLGTPYEGTNPPELYHKYVGHDNNRDWYAFSQVETQLTVDKIHNVWHPQIVHDIHQQGANGSRLFLPPYMEPVEPNVPKQIVEGFTELGDWMATDLRRRGLEGITTNTTYDAWTPARAYSHHHGGVRILSETASARIASPITVKFDDLRTDGVGGLNSKAESAKFGPIWKGGEWKLRNITDYMTSAAFSLLTHAAENREKWLSRFYAIGKEAVRPRKAGQVTGFVLPFDQKDYSKRDADAHNPAKIGTNTNFDHIKRRELLIDILRKAQVEVIETDRLTIGGKSYPRGSAFIPAAQPYWSFAKALLERQIYPDLKDGAGNPITPYDVTAHTLPLLMDVKVELATGSYQASRSIAPWGGSYGTGCSHPPTFLTYRSDVPSMDEGWTRWVIEKFKTGCGKYDSISTSQVMEGSLDRARAIIFPDQSANQILNGHRKGTMPDEYTGGVGKEGVENLKKFVEAGGTLVFLNGSSSFAIEHFKLPVKDVTKGLPRKDFYIPGSILRTELDIMHPMAKGMPKESIAWFEDSPAVEIQTDPLALTNNFRIIARYPSDPKQVLLSGWALGAEKIAGKAALVEFTIGKGRIVLFGFRPQYRGQSLATFPLLFNAISN